MSCFDSLGERTCEFLSHERLVNVWIYFDVVLMQLLFMWLNSYQRFPSGLQEADELGKEWTAPEEKLIKLKKVRAAV
jgi:hypothetical protein